MLTMVFETGNTVVRKIEKVFVLRAYIPVGKMNNKQADLSQAVCKALGMEK